MIGFGRCGLYTQWNTYSAIKKNDIMPFAATWMELETLILSEMSQKDKDKYHMISLIYYFGGVFLCYLHTPVIVT